MTGRGKGKVLVIDDEALACEMLAKFLEREGYAVTAAYDGEEGVKKAKEYAPDAILLDIRMPGMDGMEALKRIRESDADCVIVMTTAVDDLATALACIRAGANDFLRKPVVLFEVQHAIESGIEKRNLKRENRDYQNRLEEKVAEQTGELRQINSFLKRTNIAVFNELRSAIGSRDRYTREHGERVVRISKRLGKVVGLSVEAMEALEYGALMHDIGGFGIGAGNAKSACNLGEEACKKIDEHPQLGWEMIHNGNAARRESEAAGPEALTLNTAAGRNMDLIARIVMIADAFDALTCDRPHKKGLPVEKALKVLQEYKGTHFDPALVDTFIKEKSFLSFQ